MASSQCYRPSQEITRETKCHDNTYGHKASHHGHEHNGNSNNHSGHFYGHEVSHVAGIGCKENHHGQHSTNHSHGHNNVGHHSSSSHGNGIGYCNGKTEKKVENKCEYKKKSYSKKSCNDSDSD
ncbi:PREDICTED: probable serine/threonine-protein kinase fhkB isoform X3 [Lupinus angustifolius]|uniref:probable serine/threonine-protein kinase fhkB isoform X3 n=1 Tax=Lupinus angustifolius TaxID=3871 RepID=UPI00092F4EE7|nr:PREDICTED: probable serine/threonine-protein kinase fhkB isoform X3 [Lupinus angustifolius]